MKTGDRLGSYEIVAPLGAGGMGEVYRARDMKLKRDVALKVLPEAFASNPERMLRFQREAEVLASLNHPNIAAIYGVEQRALVMELVEGESPKGPLLFEDAWKIGMQIADALEYAHEKGVVHRDLKHANIKVTLDGVVKLLDFGLAKAFSTQRETSASPENSPTLTMGATEVGVILGTAAYMAPEQARGKTVDKRADIWSFGVVFYELLTGERLFHGDDAAETLAAVIHKQPDLSKVSPQVRRLLEECLQKDPKQRLRDIGDAKRLVAQETSPSPAPVRSQSRLGWISSGLVTVVAVGLGIVAYHATRPAELKPLVRLDVDLGPDVSLGAARGSDVILSPNGTRLLYVSKQKLLTRRLDQPQATELAGTEGATEPFFSPDGQWVAFFAGGKLKRLSLEGGAPEVLCDAIFGNGGSWGEDGNIIASLSPNGALSRVSSTGGAPTPTTELAAGEIRQRWPQVLPGGKAVIVTSYTTSGPNIDVISLTNRSRKTVQRGGLFGRYLATSDGLGHVVYLNNSTLFAVAFDSAALEVRGTPVPLLDRVASNPTFAFAKLDASQRGTLVYRSGVPGGEVTVQWLDSTGKTEPLLAKPGAYTRPRLSPDGQRLALEVPEGSQRDVWIYEWQRDTLTRLSFDNGGNTPNPVWTPDGRYLVFQGKGGIYWTRSDGAGKPQPLTRSNEQQVPWSFTPDGKRLSYYGSNRSKDEIWTMPLETDGTRLRGGKPALFLQTPFDDRYPTFSSDGHWLAYASNESGTYQIYVRAFPDKGGLWQISNGGGVYPVWSRNGHELFFRSLDNRIIVTAYKVKGDSFVAEKPRQWSERRLADFGVLGTSTYDVAPDGKRIVALMPVETPGEERSQSHVTFLLNFGDELRRKVPLK